MSALFPSVPESDEERQAQLAEELKKQYAPQTPTGKVSRLRQQQFADALAGLQRALARGAPAGSEGSSVWTSPFAPDMQTLAQRAQDRRGGTTATSYPFNMDAFFEGLKHNDLAASIAGPNPNVKVIGLGSEPTPDIPPDEATGPVSGLRSAADDYYKKRYPGAGR